MLTIFVLCCRLRDERGETERALALDHKQRDHSSHNGESSFYLPAILLLALVQ
jgi:hypothetical protein